MPGIDLLSLPSVAVAYCSSSGLTAEDVGIAGVGCCTLCVRSLPDHRDGALDSHWSLEEE